MLILGLQVVVIGGKNRDARMRLCLRQARQVRATRRRWQAKLGQKGLSNAGAKRAPPAGAASARGNRSLQINSRKQLYFEFGGPVPPAVVCTPQTARSKVRRCLAALGGGVHVRGGCATVP